MSHGFALRLFILLSN